MTGKGNWNKYSKDRLEKIIAEKIRTTMIGALAAIEKHLKKHEDVFDEEYNNMRKDILDKGNAQIRNIETELDRYEVNWLRYTMTLPVKPMGQKGGNDEE